MSYKNVCKTQLMMAHGGRQDLVLFGDNSLISDTILGSDFSYLSIIGYTQGTSPTWLVNSLIENALTGIAKLLNKDLTKFQPERSEVHFVSFLNDKGYYIRGCKRNGLDLASMDNFKYYDLFSDLFTAKIKSPAQPEHDVKEIFDGIISSIEKSKSSEKIVFVEGVEILLNATNVSTISMLSHIMNLNKSCRQLFFITPQDSPKFVDMNNSDNSALHFKMSDFISKLFHRSNLNLQLSPLSTGRANDISGSLSVSKGCLPLDGVVIMEREYVFFISKESNINMYYR